MSKYEKELTLLGGKKTKYPRTPEEAKIELFSNPVKNRLYNIRFNVPEFTSLCPKTGQPDFANIVIDYVPARECIESKALKLYMFSFRNHGAFHETVTNEILDRLFKSCDPFYMRVTALFYKRGGISIDLCPEKWGVSSKKILYMFEQDLEANTVINLGVIKKYVRDIVPAAPIVLEAAGRWQ